MNNQFRKSGLKGSITTLSAFLTFIKNIPWFTLLLLVLLGYGGYQISKNPHSQEYIWIKQSSQKLKSSLLKSLFLSRTKNTMSLPVYTQTQPEPHKALNHAQTALDYQPIEVSKALEENDKILEAKIRPFKQEIQNLQKNIEAFKRELAAIRDDFNTQSIECATNHSHQADFSNIHPEMQDLRKNIEALKFDLAAIRDDFNTQLAVDKTASVPRLDTNTASLPDSTKDSSRSNTALDAGYSVHAVIEGRAWLNTKEGKLTTVNVGSQLPILGVVKAIDAESRLVYFDAGIVIGPPALDC